MLCFFGSWHCHHNDAFWHALHRLGTTAMFKLWRDWLTTHRCAAAAGFLATSGGLVCFLR
jgi:hypothetical protein